MLKVLIKLFFLPLFAVVVPLLLLLSVLRHGAVSAQSVKKALNSSGVYSRSLDAVQKAMFGFSVSDIAAAGKNDPEAAAFAKTFTGIITDSYIKEKIEKAVDDTGAWASGVSKTAPSISFEDLKAGLLSKHKGGLDDLGSILDQITSAVPKEIMSGPSQQAPPSDDAADSNPFTLSSLVKKNPVIPLGPYVFWIKGIVWFIGFGWYAGLFGLAVAALIIMLLSNGVRGKLRWLGIIGIVSCIGLLVARRYFYDPNVLFILLYRWLPKQAADIAVPVLGAVAVKPLLQFQVSVQSALQRLSLVSIALVAVSYVDAAHPFRRKNIAIVMAGIVSVAVAYVSVYPGAATLPLIGKYMGSPSVRISTGPLVKTGTFGISGGSVEVVGADSTATITVPKHALVYKTAYKASSVTSMTGLPPGTGFVAGVDITADEALLSAPAAITFTLDEAPKTALRGIAYEDGGKKISIFPVRLHDKSVTIPALHFSGYGLIAVPDTFKSPERSNDVRTTAQQDILGFMDWIQTTQAFGMNERLSESQVKGLTEILRDWWVRGVKPFLERALTADTEIVPAVKEYLIWLQAVQAMGFESQFGTEIKTSEQTIAKAIKKAADTASKTCRENRDPAQAGKLLKLYAIGESLGLDGTAGLNVDTLKKQALACATFKLSIQSRFTVEDGKVCSVGEDESYSGEIELTPDEDFTLSGKGVVKADSIAVCGSQCRIEEGDGPVESTVEIPGVLFGVSDTAKDISIPVSISDETRVQYDCSYVVPGTDTDFGYHRPFGWGGEFHNMHEDEATGFFEFMITGWTRKETGDVFAEKTYDRTRKPTFMGIGVPVHEVTTLKLFHTPGK